MDIQVQDFTEIDLKNGNQTKSEEIAVEVSDVCFEYRKNIPVLNNVNIQIPRGNINILKNIHDKFIKFMFVGMFI